MGKKTTINPEMTIMDTISRDQRTEAIFRKYDDKAGVCLCCQALFDPLKEVARRYKLDLSELISDLESVAK